MGIDEAGCDRGSGEVDPCCVGRQGRQVNEPSHSLTGHANGNTVVDHVPIEDVIGDEEVLGPVHEVAASAEITEVASTAATRPGGICRLMPTNLQTRPMAAHTPPWARPTDAHWEMSLRSASSARRSCRRPRGLRAADLDQVAAPDCAAVLEVPARPP